MRLARCIAGVALLLTLVLVSTDGFLQSQDKKDPPKLKGFVPQGWGKLNLTAAQKESIYKIQNKYKDEVKKLKDAIADLDAKERKELIGILTDEQKKMLTEGLEPSKEGKEKDKAKDKGKDG